MTGKRKMGPDSQRPRKRIKVTSAADPSAAVDAAPSQDRVSDQGSATLRGEEPPQHASSAKTSTKGKERAIAPDDAPASDEVERQKAPLTRPTRRIKKLQPPRPFPTVPTSVSATGPRSAHHEGKNLICITRRTPLGAYMRRCKEVVIKDGYKTLHLNAMGAAIPHLLQLVVTLPQILPFPADEIHTQIQTGTVNVQDEVIPDDDDEQITYETRGKSSLAVIVKIGDGQREGDGGTSSRSQERHDTSGKTATVQKHNKSSKRKHVHEPPETIVFQEPEQDDMDAV